jgi:hypothetical protein
MEKGRNERKIEKADKSEGETERINRRIEICYE